MNTDSEQTGFNRQPENPTHINSLTQENATESNAIEIPEISLPKGGGALRGIDEKFEVNASNGTAGFSIPLPITPGRNGFSPNLTLSYNSGNGNSPFGLGWSINFPSIQRKTDKQLPRYRGGAEEDIFMFSGAEDLVPFLEEDANGEWEEKEYPNNDPNAYIVKRYRPRVEGGFAKIEKIYNNSHGVYWKVTTRENVTTIFGRSVDARIANPKDESQIFQWLPEFSFDDKGNWIQYHYKIEDLEKEDLKEENSQDIHYSSYEKNRLNSELALFTNKYLKRVKYGNKTPYYLGTENPFDPPAPSNTNNEHFFELVFDYGEHNDDIPTPDEVPDQRWNYRTDPFSNYRAGFEIRTNRLCKRILMFHHFENEKQLTGYDGDGNEILTDFGKDYLVRSLDFIYKPSVSKLEVPNGGQNDSFKQAAVTYLTSVTQCGYIKKADDSYSKKSLPPMEFEYQELNWNKEIKNISAENIVNAPVGLTNNYQWIDLYNEGISGILTEQGNGWYYKSNLGDVDEDGNIALSIAKKVIPKPSFTGLNSGILSIQDLEANGEKQVVINSPSVKGYFELEHNNNWSPFREFEEVANINFQDPNTRLIDLNGDGQADIVVTEDNVLVWYPSNGKKGYLPAEFYTKTFDEERGPAIVFADQEQTIFLADMVGDGLTDIVRIRNGEICYWANMGYGKFSPKINMSNAPWFDHPDLFNPQYLHLADVSGTGATDILYLGKNLFKAYLNLSGNVWSDVHEIAPFFPINRNSRLSVIDLLGKGTSCIVWSSDLPEHSNSPMRYIDLMNGKKPHVLIHYKNNFGKETSVEYKSSTHYYLKDKLEGKPWITKLPFPVQVVSRLTVEDKITNVRFSGKYIYHHGYYDHPEREFRGFGMVEQIDSEFYEAWKKTNGVTKLEQSEELFQKPVLTKTWFHTGAFLDRERILNQFKEEYWYEEYQRKFSESLNVSEPELQDAKLIRAQSISDENINIIENLTADEWREALRACKGMMLRQEVFALYAPEGSADDSDESKLQAKPYTVATHNCNIQLLQPRSVNPYAVFMVTESEAITIHYEREETDPRIAHNLNIKIDELGNVLESASVVYPRLQEDTSLPQDIRDKQKETHIIYTRNSFTNDVTQSDSDYRLRLPAETETFELTQLDKTGDLYQIDDFKDNENCPPDCDEYRRSILEKLFEDGKVIKYHENPSDSETNARLIEHIRTIYRRDNFGVPDEDEFLPFKELESKALPYESYQLAYTSEMVTKIYGVDKIADVNAIMTKGGFIHSVGDSDANRWWIRSGIMQLIDKANGEIVQDVKNRFYSPFAYSDPFGAVTKVSYYKDYYLFIEETEDAIENKVKVERFNFRTLAPQISRDPNDNLSAVLTDELGLVKAVAILGKEIDIDNDGDLDLIELDNLSNLKECTDAEQQTIEDFFKTEDSNVLNTLGEILLKNATTRFVYNFGTSGKPTVVASINRETHTADLGQGEKSKLQFTFEYSDGMGNVAMTKVQAEPGEAKQVVIDQAGNCTIEIVNTETNSRLRWVGNGKTVLNNKGNPVKQYEPFFSVTPHYEDLPELTEIGVTPIIYYDSLGRNIKTELPDGSFTKVEFDSWKQVHYDQNDTVLESQWYENRGSPDPSNPNPDQNDKEITVAWKTANHANTPSTLILDSLGRPVFSIAHNRVEKDDGTGVKVWMDEYYHTKIHLDIEGNVSEVTDARDNPVMLYGFLENPNDPTSPMIMGYDMLGHRVYQNSMDAGRRWMLNNVMGNPVKRWDEREHVFTFEYDALQRPIESKVEDGDGNTPLDNVFDKIIYGEGQTNDKKLNLRGQVFEQYDTAGKLSFEEYDIKGNLIKSSRRFAKKYKETVNWTGNLNTLLETETFTTESEFDALNRVIWSKTPDENITKPTYNEANFLETVTVEDKNQNEQIFVKNIDYDAKGQRESITYGNDLITTYAYDPKTFRLIRLQTCPVDDDKSDNVDLALQDLHYTYDPVGNISEIEDKCQPIIFFNGNKTTHRNQYTYDALYRLTRASGREHIGQVSHNDNDNWNDLPFKKQYSPGDSMAWRPYTQCYEYDSVGNIMKMIHQANGGSWTRNYEYHNDNNRLKTTSVGGQSYDYDHHSTHGFIATMPHLSVMDWNFKDELQATSRQVVNSGTPETTYYVYDGSGQRVRKITENQATDGNTPTKKEERLYLGGIEIYRKHSGSHNGLERTTLHIMDDTRRIAMIDTRNNVNDGTDKKTTRYQFGNHLGTVAMETNEDAEVITYEEYHPYGTTAYQAVNKSVKAAAKRYRYTGMERDEESGLNYHGARYYILWLGRWLSSDPIGIGDGVNDYQYVQNNPIYFNDLEGTQTEGEENKVAIIFRDEAEKDASSYDFKTHAQALKSKGFNVVFVETGQQLLEELQTNSGESPISQLVILSHGTETGLGSPLLGSKGLYTDNRLNEIARIDLESQYNETYNSIVNHLNSNFPIAVPDFEPYLSQEALEGLISEEDIASKAMELKTEGAATISDITRLISENKVEFTEDISIIIGGCNTGVCSEVKLSGHEFAPTEDSFAEQLAESVGATSPQVAVVAGSAEIRNGEYVGGNTSTYSSLRRSGSGFYLFEATGQNFEVSEFKPSKKSPSLKVATVDLSKRFKAKNKPPAKSPSINSDIKLIHRKKAMTYF